jgi:hypothetical protein
MVEAAVVEPEIVVTAIMSMGKEHPLFFITILTQIFWDDTLNNTGDPMIFI